MFFQRIFPKSNKAEIVDRTVGKSIYTVYKNAILTINLLRDDLEDLATALSG